jgi:hypothetical protein
MYPKSFSPAKGDFVNDLVDVAGWMMAVAQ